MHAFFVHAFFSFQSLLGTYFDLYYFTDRNSNYAKLQGNLGKLKESTITLAVMQTPLGMKIEKIELDHDFPAINSAQKKYSS